MSLREDLLKQNGVTAIAPGSSSKVPATSSNPLRDKLLADNKIGQPSTTGATVVSNREALLKEKGINQPAPKFTKTDTPVTKVPKSGLMGDTTISAAPEGNFVQRAFNKGKEVITGALSDFGNKANKALGIDKSQQIDLESGKVPAPRSGVETGADLLRAGVAGANVVFAPISSLFVAAEEVPVLKYPAKGVNYIFGKLGEAGSWVGSEAVDTLPVTDATKEVIRPAAEELSALLAQVAGGKLGHTALKKANERTADLRNQIKENITKDVTVTHNLPQTVYIDAAKVKDIFQTGKKISPEEQQMISSLGLTGEQYRNAIDNGISISIPSEKIVTVTDKPWFAKIKDAIGIQSVPDVTKVSSGDIQTAPRALLDAPDTDITSPRIVETPVKEVLVDSEQSVLVRDTSLLKEPGIWDDTEKVKQALKTKEGAEQTRGELEDQLFDAKEKIAAQGGRQQADSYLIIQEKDAVRGIKKIDEIYDDLPSARKVVTLISDPVPDNVAKVVSEPITSKSFDTINAFTPEEFSAFGRKLVQGLNSELSKNDVSVNEQIDSLKYQKSVLEDTGFRSLTKYESKSGEFKGELNTNNGTGKFASQYDTTLREVFGDIDNNFTTDELKQKYEDLKKSYKNITDEIKRLETKGSVNNYQSPQITEAAARKAGLPDSIDVIENGSPDGRPAQFKQGKIQVFLPDLVRDIKALAEGKKILAHGGENAKVYAMKPGESFDQLALRYTKDVLVHELSHEKTVNLEDNTKMQQLRQEVIKARQTGDQGKIIEANTKIQKFMQELETKALNYERANRKALEDEIFAKESTSMQRRINRVVSPETPKKIITNEKTLLKERLKSQATGARAGKLAGKMEGEKNLDAAKIGFGETLKKLKEKEATLQQKRHALVEYAEAFLPVSERGKFIRVIRYPGSDKNFFDILGRMQEASKNVERKAIISEISTELKGAKVQVKDKKPNAKFEYEAQKKLDRIRANINGDYVGAQQKIVDIISEFQANNPDSVLPSDILEQIQELKMVGIKDMNVEELRNTLADIKSIKETGRTLKDLERFNRDTAIQQVRDATIQTLTGGLKNPKADIGLRRPEDKPTSFEKVGDFFTLQQAGFEELLDAVSKFDKTSKPYQSFLNRHFTTKTSESFAKQDTGEIKQVDKINTMIKDTYGFKKDSDLYTYLNEMHELKKLEDVTMADGSLKKINVTKAEALQFYMWSKDETLHDTFTEGLNWGEDAQKRVFDLLSEKDKKMADNLLGFYREYYKGINEVFQREYGVDLPFNENYSPVSRNVETSIPENVMLAQEMKSYATAKNNSLKSRVQNNIELKPKDAFQNVTSHINMMEHYKAWSETMYEARRVFGDKEVRRTLEDYHGRKFLKEIDSFLNDFARDGVDRSKIVPIVDTLRMNTTKAILGINPSVAIKQLTGLSNYLIEIPTGDFFTGVTNFWSSPLTKAKFLQDNSPVLRERFGDGYERDIKAALGTDYAKKLSHKGNKLSETMFVFLRQADKFTVLQGSWAAYRSGYNQAIKEGKSSAEAKKLGIKNAEDITNRVQESSRLDTLSPLQRGGSYAKALTMLQSQPSKYSRIIWNVLRNIKYGRGDKATNIKRFIILYFVVPTLYNTVGQLLTDEKYRDTPGEFTGKILLGPLTYPLIAGQIFQSLYGWSTGSRFAYNATPILSIMDDMQKMVGKLANDDFAEAMTYFGDVAGKLRGVPTPIVTRPMREVLKEEKAGGASYPVN